MQILKFLPEFGSGVLYAAGLLIPIVNPPGAAPIFLSLTTGINDQTRGVLAKRICINTFIMLVITMFVGNFLLGVFGIDLSVVRIAGGVLVLSTAWSLLNAQDDDNEHSKELVKEVTLEQAKRNAFFPMTFPIICGPGSLSVAITVGASLHPITDKTGQWLLNGLGALVGMFLVTVTLFFALFYASRLVKFLGPNGTAVFMRLSAFLLLCIGVQILWSGIYELVTSTHWVFHQAPTVSQALTLPQGVISDAALHPIQSLMHSAFGRA